MPGGLTAPWSPLAPAAPPADAISSQGPAFSPGPGGDTGSVTSGGLQPAPPPVPSGYFGNPSGQPAVPPGIQPHGQAQRFGMGAPFAGWGGPPRPAYQFGQGGAPGTQYGQPITAGNTIPNIPASPNDPTLFDGRPPGPGPAQLPQNPWATTSVISLPPAGTAPGPGPAQLPQNPWATTSVISLPPVRPAPGPVGIPPSGLGGLTAPPATPSSPTMSAQPPGSLGAHWPPWLQQMVQQLTAGRGQ